jgi:large subunit ribosomal protein L20
MLSELAISDVDTFNEIVKTAKNALPADVNAPKSA